MSFPVHWRMANLNIQVQPICLEESALAIDSSIMCTCYLINMKFATLLT